MKKFHLCFIALGIIFIMNACSRKTVPERSPDNNSNSTSKNTAVNAGSAGTTTTPVKKVKKVIPKVISVNDAAATKTVDGRYYYDLEGHRYWRNKKDGKYYLYNVSMGSDPNFKP